MRKIVLPIFIFIYLQSCASKPLEEHNTEFLTRITASGLKHFEVRLKRDSTRERDLGQDQRGMNDQRRREKRPNSEKVEKALVGAANAHLETNGYCSTGFWVIESNAYVPGLSLRGECNETASEEDKSRYPDTIKVW